MVLTFTSEPDLVVYMFAVLLRLFCEHNNIFAAQCIWVIVHFTGLKPALVDFIHTGRYPSQHPHAATNGVAPHQSNPSTPRLQQENPTVGQLLPKQHKASIDELRNVHTDRRGQFN